MGRKLKGKKGIIFWLSCLFIAFTVLITYIPTTSAAMDPNQIITSSDIPDSILLAKLTTLANTDSDGTITFGELANYSGPIDLSNLNITSVQGLSYATGATEVNLSGNNSLTTIPDKAFIDCTKLTKVVLPDSILSIGNSAFEGCKSLNNVNLPANLTTIGSQSFLQCSSLTNITLPTVIVSIGDSAFSGSGLTSIVIPNPQVKIGNGCFNGCAALQSVSLPEGMTTIPMECFKATKSLTNITFPTTLTLIDEGAFNGSNLASVDLTKCTNLTAIKRAAFSGTPIISVNLPESLTELGPRTFENCQSLPQITIPSKITIINYLTFSYCTSLTNVTFTPAAPNDYKLQEIDYNAFYACYQLGNGNVQFLANLNNLTTIGDYAFAYCAQVVKNSNGVPILDEYNQQTYKGIQSVTLPNSLVSLGNYAFLGCSSLTQINIPDKVTELKTQTFKNCSNLSNVSLSATLTAIDANCFENCKSLNNLTFPQSLKTIGTYAFLNCANEKYKTVLSQRQYVYTGLPSLIIPDSVTDIGASAFSGCFNLSSVKLPTNLTKLNDSVFQGCAIQNKSATGVLIPGSYRGIQTINIPSTLTSIGNSTFNNCYNLYSDGTTLAIPYGLVSIGSSAFSSCGKISAVDFQRAGSLTTIGSSAFNKCTNLDLLNFPMAGSLNTIGASAFANTGIKGILRIPDKVKIITNNVFQNCTGITSVEFPDALTSIGSSAFVSCTSLTSVTIPAAATFVSMGTGSSFYGCINFSNAIVKPVPADVPVYENGSAILPIKCFTTIDSVVMGDESIATAVLDQTKLQVTINGVKTGQTTATVNGTIQYQAGTDPYSGKPTIKFFQSQVQFNANVTAIKATSVSFPQSQRGVKLSTSTLTLTPTIIPSNTTDLKYWSSDNPLVATVSSTGVVTPVSYGTTTIRLKVGDLPEVQCQVNVCAPANGLRLDKSAQTLVIGQSVTITPTLSYSSPTYDNYKTSYPDIILWSSSDTNIARVDNRGVVTAVGYGIANITAKADAGGVSSIFTATVIPQSSQISFDKTSTAILKGNQDKLTMTVTPSNLPSSLITVSSSNPTVVTVSVNQNTITVTAQKGGTAKITAQPLNGTAATCDVSVISPLTSITTTAMTINKGASRTISKTVTPSDATDVLVYSSNNTAVATVDATGKVTAVSAGSSIIHVSSRSNPSISADCTVTVVVPVTGITLSSTTATLYYKNSLQLTATVAPTDATNKNVIWTSSNLTVATVDQSGKVTPVNLGTAIIKVSSAEGNIYATCNVTVVNTVVVNRLAGSNRLQTAVQISKQGWPNGSNVVILSRDDNFPDALAGAPLAHKYNAPILLTNSLSLSTETAQEIDRLKPTKVIILGSTGAVSSSIELQLKAKYTVERLGGSDRFATAVKIAEALGSRGKAVIAYGMNFPDALAISPWAAYNNIPILLTDTDTLPSATAAALQELGITQTIVVGGTGVISDSVAQKLPSPTRYFGSNRYQTAISIAKSLGSDTSTLFVATGDNFPDALAGSALAGRTGSAMVLVDSTLSDPQVSNFLTNIKGKVGNINVLGATGVVPTTVVDKIINLVN
jgi:uncharacterized protein YjdB